MLDLFLQNLEPFLQRPIANLSLIFGVVMALLLVAPLLAKKARLPGVVGLLIAGALVGPNGLELFERNETFRLLGQVGLVYIMFLAGLEIDLNRFAKYKNHSLVFGFITFMVPQTLGTLAGLYILNLDLLVSILLASMFASHTLLAYPTVSRLGLSKNVAVTAAVGGTIITDTAALIVLAIVLGAWAGGLNAAFFLTLGLGLGIYTFLVFWTIPKLGRWFFRKVSSEGVLEYVFVLSVVFCAAVLSEVAGVKDIIGAFLAGLALNRLIPESSTLMNRIEFIGNALFIPFFLISVGMLVNVGVLFGSVDALIIAGTMVACVLTGKLLAAKIAQKVLKQTPEEGMVVFGLTVAQAAATLAVVLVAFDEGIFDEAVLNGTIVMIAVTCFVAPMVTEKFGRKMALQQQEGHTDEGEESPQRFLVPMSYKATSQSLMDLTFVIREHHSEEPVFPLSVVRDDDETANRVADAEKMLSAAVVHGAAAEIPVVPVTRVAHNPASGIARAVVERRVSDIVLGWQGPDTSSRSPYGRITDQVLAETQQQVLIAHLTQPIATVARVIVVFPPNIEFHPGYTRAIRDAKRLTNNVGALLTGLCLKDEMRKIRSRVDTVKPELASSFVGFTSMENMITTLEKRVAENDLILFLTARRGTAPWTPELEDLPRRVAELTDYSLVFMVLSDMDVAITETIEKSTGLASHFSARRIVPSLQATTEKDAVAELLRTHFDEAQEELLILQEELLKDGGFVREQTQGFLLMNARTPAVRRPQLYFGAFPDGISLDAYPDKDVFGLFCLASPEETPLQDHLALFTELSQLVTRIEDCRALSTIDEPARLLEELRHLANDPEARFPDSTQTLEIPRTEDLEA